MAVVCGLGNMSGSQQGNTLGRGCRKMIKPSFKPACLVLFTRLGRRAAQEGGGLAGNRTVASSIPGSSQLGVGVSLSETPHPDGS